MAGIIIVGSMGICSGAGAIAFGAAAGLTHFMTKGESNTAGRPEQSQEKTKKLWGSFINNAGFALSIIGGALTGGACAFSFFEKTWVDGSSRQTTASEVLLRGPIIGLLSLSILSLYLIKLGNRYTHEAYDPRLRKLSENNSLLPADQTNIKKFINQELLRIKAPFQAWNERREQFERDHPYEVFPEQPTSWSSDPTIQKQNADWGMAALSAQAQDEIVPGLWLAGNYTPEVTHGFDAKAKAEAYALAIAATNRSTDYVERLKQTCTTYYQIENAPGAGDVGVGSFSTNNSHSLKTAISSINEALRKNEKVLVFCQQGADRSATVVIAYLMATYSLSFEDALIYVRSRRFIAKPNTEYQEFLKTFEGTKWPA